MTVRLSRRTFIGTSAALATARPVLAAPSPRLAVVALRAAQCTRPIGIDDVAPALSWRLEGPEGTRQAAYRVTVASAPAHLNGGSPDLWDSGWQVSDDIMCVRYAGRRLASRLRCYWTVSVRGGNGQVTTGPVEHWEMGLLAPEDWSGAWLAAEDEIERDDRLAGAQWVEAPAAPDAVRIFQLLFETRRGEAAITLAIDGRLHGIDLDGEPLQPPLHDPNAFGGPPAMRFICPVADGAHRLTVRLGAVPGYFTKPTVALAGQVRLAGIGATLRRIAGGWQVQGEGGDWQEAVQPAQPPVFPWPATPARLFRRRFTLDRPPAAARLRLAALGGADIWINGRPVSDAALQPEQADFARAIPYRSHDVTALLRPGTNVIALMVADGFYASYMAPAGRYSFGAAPRRFLLELEMHGADGIRKVVTDPEWRSATAALRYSEIYGGEDWDLAYEQRGWTQPDFDDADWAAAWAAPSPDAPLVARFDPPVRIIRTLAPQSIVRVAEDRHIIDFGQSFAGRIRLKLPVGATGSVRVRHAEILTPEGALDRRNLRAARAEDRYVLQRTGGSHQLEPRFTYQGFRYAEIDGLASLEGVTVEGLVISSDLGETGTLVTDQSLVQKIWSNTLWSQRANFIGVPTDCPQRDERLGWSGDAQIFWDTAAYNMDVAAFARVFLGALRQGQAPSGAFPLWAPFPKAAGFGPGEPTPGWADAGVMLPYITCLHSGDRTIIDDNWRAMRHYVDGVTRANPDGLWRRQRGADFGDWLSVDAKTPADETTPKTLVATAMLARSVAQLAAMARWTGRTAEAAEFEALRSRIGNAFARAFVTADGEVGNGSHSSYILALALDLVPRSLRARAADRLAAGIRKRGTALSTGFLGTPLALDALADTGHAGLAYDLLLRSDFPSWGYMIRRGATTMWERWNGDTGDVAMNSYNHYAFGAVSGFLYRRAAGIQPLSPGFGTVRIAPLPDARIGRLRCRYESARGPIDVGWHYGRGRITVEVMIPAGSIAEIVPPAGARLSTAGSSVAPLRVASGHHRLMFEPTR